MNQDNFKKVCEKIESYRDEMIEFQTAITAIPAISPVSGGEGEWKKCKLIEKYLKEFGAEDVQIVEVDDPAAPEGTRPSILARIEGEDRSKTIWVMSHMDVVPEGDRSEWKSDPWKVEVRDGKLYGRGVEDNQQGMTGSVFAMKAFKELGIKPKHDYAVAIVADEENGSQFGIGPVIEKSKAFKPQDLVVVPDMGSAEGDIIEIAEKSILWIEFVLKGKQTHGSTPGKGINAHLAGADLILRLHKTLHEKYNKQDDLYDPPMSTFTPTKKEANVPNINTVPAEDRFSFDCRILPDYSVDEVVKTIDEIVADVKKEHGVMVEYTHPQRADAAPATRLDAQVVKSLELAVQDVYHVKARPVGVGGGTVAAFFRHAGIPAACWSKMHETMHSPNEYCIIENMVGDTKVFAHIALQ